MRPATHGNPSISGGLGAMMHDAPPPEFSRITGAELRAKYSRLRDEFNRLDARVDGAKLCSEVLADLHHLADSAPDTVTLAEAAELTGRTADHLGRMIRRNQLPNVGRKHAPRIPRDALTALGVKGVSSDHASSTVQVAPEDSATYNVQADARSLMRRRALGGTHGA